MAIIIGTVSPNNESGQLPGDYVLLYRFQASASGQVELIRIKTGESGTVKVAVYADNSGEPGSLLNAVNTPVNVTADLETLIPIAATALTSGAYYWLAVAEASGQRYYFTSSSSGTRRYKTITYSGYSFPNPAGTGYGSDNYDCYIAGETAAVKLSADSGNGTDTSALQQKTLFRADAGQSADAGGILVHKTSAEPGGGLDTGGKIESLISLEAGRGRDTLALAARKAGYGLQLYHTRGEVGIPQKEVDL
jgi:hypothetical protein